MLNIHPILFIVVKYLVLIMSQINFGLQNKHKTEFWTLSSTKSSSLRHNARGVIFPFTLVSITSRPLRSRKLCITAAAAGSGGSSSRRGANSRRVYQQSQAQAPVVPVKEIASSVLPVGAFVVVIFGMHSSD